MDTFTDKKRLSRRTRKGDKRPSEELGKSELGEVVNTASIAPPPIFKSPSAPIDLRQRVANEVIVAGDVDEPIDLGEPGGRRSRAHRDSDSEKAEFKIVERAVEITVENTADRVETVPKPNPFQVVRGGVGLAAEEEVSSRNLSPSTAAAIGDFTAAMIGPIAGALAVNSVGVFAGSALFVQLGRARARRSALTEGEVSGISPVIAALGVLAMTLAIDPGHLLGRSLVAAAICLVAGALAAILLNVISERVVHTRVAVIGSAAHAHDLAWALANEGINRYTVVGYVGPANAKENVKDLKHVSFKVRRLGVLADLSHLVARNDVDMLVLADGSDRLEAFERAAVCAERYRTRLIGLLAFEEVVFQRVALEQLNVAWMQHLMHPRFRPAPRIATRAFDILGALVIGIVTAPAWLLALPLVVFGTKGSVLVRQRRVGERGRSFSIVKFRTADDDGGTSTETPTDAERTAVGRLLHRLHVDALPLLLNILRGDLSLVGPFPAQPALVTKIEQEFPFYGRRHLVKPGVTGWAQLRGRVAEGEDADMINLSRDLFYLKHQSLFLYGYVLLATAWATITRSLNPREL